MGRAHNQRELRLGYVWGVFVVAKLCHVSGQVLGFGRLVGTVYEGEHGDRYS